ncbi:hypothetical protein IJT17_06310 [bacterium]|nr:hypothetical protein [bacterium]
MTKKKLVNTEKPKKAEPLIRPERSKKLIEFSFRYLDRNHELFNLGAPRTKNNNLGIIEAKWFIHLLDALKEASNRTVSELSQSSVHDLHSVDPTNINPKIPEQHKDEELKQFRLNKSRGRVVGFLIDNIFHIVWLDPYHNLTNCREHLKPEKYPEPDI